MLTASLLVCMTLGDSPGQGPLPTSAAVVQAVGIGYPPPRMSGAQGRLMARRAAEVVAVRNLTVKLRIGPQGRLPAFRYVATKHHHDGSVEVTVETRVPPDRNANAPPTKGNGVRPQRRLGARP